MAPKPLGQPKKPRATNTTAIATVLKPRGSRPIVPLHKAQAAAADVRRMHPTLDDETAALCVLHVSTNMSVAAISRAIGADPSWCYARIARPDVQSFLQQLSQTLLGVAAARAISTVKQLAENSESERMRFDASVELMDRAGMGNTSQQRGSGLSQAFAFSFGTEKPT